MGLGEIKMTFKEKRAYELELLMKNLSKFCIDNDLRLGQAIEIIMTKNMDSLFNIENDDLNDIFISYIAENQNLIK